MVDYAGIIKSSIPMPDVAERYTGQRIVRNRIRCPIHHGSDLNMRIYRSSYHCFVCHATGDVIQFVQSVLGLSFQDAMKRLNEDFRLNLPIGEKLPEQSKAQLTELNRRNAARMFQERMTQIGTDIDGTHQANLAGMLNAVERICVEERPRTPWDEWKPVWCMAMRLRTELMEEVK